MEGEEDEQPIDLNNPYEKFRSKNEKKLANKELLHYEETSEERFVRFQVEFLKTGNNSNNQSSKSNEIKVENNEKNNENNNEINQENNN